MRFLEFSGSRFCLPLGAIGLALFCLGCRKEAPRETIPKLVLDREEGRKAPTKVEPVPVAKVEEPVETPPDVDEFPDSVRAPVADDLAVYTKDYPGDGPLLADFETSMGTVTCELTAEDTPVTVANFVGLASGAKPFIDPQTGERARRRFYDGTIFHRVIPRFMIQGGDPLGVGRGGPGYQFENETLPSLKHDKAGVLAMANAGPGTNGSQFYITEAAVSHLDGRHTVFGFCNNNELIRKIARVEKGFGDKPAEDVILRHVVIRRGEAK